MLARNKHSAPVTLRFAGNGGETFRVPPGRKLEVTPAMLAEAQALAKGSKEQKPRPGLLAMLSHHFEPVDERPVLTLGFDPALLPKPPKATIEDEEEEAGPEDDEEPEDTSPVQAEGTVKPEKPVKAPKAATRGPLTPSTPS